MKSNISIKLKDHFKLYILLKDKIVFESELLNNQIPFYCDLNEQPMIDEGIRYFLLNSDRPKVDQIITDNEIIASTETIYLYDYRDKIKETKLYLYAILAVVIIMLMIAFFDKILS